MTPHSKLSAKAHQARGLVESTLRHTRTRGHGRTTAPRGHGRPSTGGDLRRMAMRVRGALRK